MKQIKEINWGDYKDRKILIYGAHLVALEVYRDICRVGFKDSVIGFAVTYKDDNPEAVEDIPVRKLSNYEGDAAETVVVIAMPGKFHEEVKNYARKHGFTEFVGVSLEDMSEIRGTQLIETWDEDSFKVRVSEYDPSWLDGVRTGADARAIYKFPTLFYLNEVQVKESMERDNPIDAYDREMGNVVNLHDLPLKPGQAGAGIKDILRIYMAFSAAEDEVIGGLKLPKWTVPIRVGNRISAKSLYKFTDDMYPGNVSDKNLLFAEMTGAWGIWHEHESVYKGLCHYRRHFVINEDEIRRLQQNNVDAILTIPRYTPGGIRGMFEAETPVKRYVVESMFEAMRRHSRQDERPFRDYMGSNFYFPNNMAIAKDKLYDEYCAWIFPILEGMLEKDIETGYGHERDRHIAYAAELLTSYFFLRKKKGIRIAVTDYRFLDMKAAGKQSKFSGGKNK